MAQSGENPSGIEALPDKDGGQVIDGSRLPSMDLHSHDGDPVREAINRAEYFEHTAIGEVGGYAVMLTAKVTDSTLSGGFRPEMTIHVDGEWDHDTATYLGGDKSRLSFETVWEMDQLFGELCRAYGLLIIPPGWSEKDTQE